MHYFEDTSFFKGDIRPRVRSFGEKESKDNPNEDTLILKVHGINEAGPDVQQDLVQVLQNRLDDAVLEFLSVMLARNSMCPLTPEDVHFIQKPFRLPEELIKVCNENRLLTSSLSMTSINFCYLNFVVRIPDKFLTSGKVSNLETKEICSYSFCFLFAELNKMLLKYTGWSNNGIMNISTVIIKI